MQPASLAAALVQMPEGHVFMWPLQHTDGGWRLAEAAERREIERAGRGRVEGGVAVWGNAIAFARCWAPLATDQASPNQPGSM